MSLLQANTQYSQQPQYSQQHQLPYNLNGALQQSAYRGQHQPLQSLGIPGHALPLGGAATAAHSPVYGDHHRSTGQALGSLDLAAQIRLQQIQNQQLRYAQPQQRHIDINTLFPPGGYRAPAANVSAIPVSCGNSPAVEIDIWQSCSVGHPCLSTSHQSLWLIHSTSATCVACRPLLSSALLAAQHTPISWLRFAPSLPWQLATFRLKSQPSVELQNMQLSLQELEAMMARQ